MLYRFLCIVILQCGYCFSFPAIDEILLQKVVSFGFSRAIVVASALMLVSPLEALAEQCQGESSFTKMPLFFAVAMIGATVTGKINVSHFRMQLLSL